MRELTTVNNQQDVRHLVAYLAVQGIEVTVEPEDGKWVVWIHNEDDWQPAQQIASDFQADPEDPKYASAERKVRHVLLEAERLQKESQRREARLQRRSSGAWWHCYPATWIMIGLCVIVVAMCSQWNPPQTDAMGLPLFCNRDDSKVLQALLMDNPEASRAFASCLMQKLDLKAEITFDDQGAPVKAKILEPPQLTYAERKLLRAECSVSALVALVRSGEVWRFVTPAFIHLHLLHLALNMLAFKNLGSAVEYLRGTGRYLILCLLLAVASSVTQYVWAGPNFGGMSGVLFGLVGYIWMKGKTCPQDGLGLTSRGITMAVLWLVLCMAGVFGNIANGAHVGGFLVGMLIGARRAVWKKIPFTKS